MTSERDSQSPYISKIHVEKCLNSIRLLSTNVTSFQSNIRTLLQIISTYAISQKYVHDCQIRTNGTIKREDLISIRRQFKTSISPNNRMW